MAGGNMSGGAKGSKRSSRPQLKDREKQFVSDRLRVATDDPGAETVVDVEEAVSTGEVSAESLVAATTPPPPPAAPTAANPAQWTPIGPHVTLHGQANTQPPCSGRINELAVSPNGSRVYAGSANGGVWYSSDRGSTWTSLMESFDQDPDGADVWNGRADSLSVGAMAVRFGSRRDRDRIYVGTGVQQDHGIGGVGVVMSPDGGETWTTEATATEGELRQQFTDGLVIDPDDREIALLAADRGLYRRDATGIWSPIEAFADMTVSSVVCAGTGSAKRFYAAPSFDFVKTSQDGLTWTKAGTALPRVRGRTILATRPGDPDTVYALTERFDGVTNAAVSRVHVLNSPDGRWRELDLDVAIPTQGTYNLAIVVDHADSAVFYVGGAAIFGPEDWHAPMHRFERTTQTGKKTRQVQLGRQVHADIHALVSGEDGTLWMGGDGGLWRSDDPTSPTANEDTIACNTGLNTLLVNSIAHHPSHSAIMFACTQDNGSVRFEGSGGWEMASLGDAGYAVVNWHAPNRVLATYIRGHVYRSESGGDRGTFFWSGPAPGQNPPGTETFEPNTDFWRFYSALVGTPPDPANPNDADVVAIGSSRPWLSYDFGATWDTIPNGHEATDQFGVRLDELGGQIGCLTFESGSRLYVGTNIGQVYRYDRIGDRAWSRVRLDELATSSGTALDIGLPVMDIAVDHSDASGRSIYAVLGGADPAATRSRRVWHFDGERNRWTNRSGPNGARSRQVPNAHHSAIIVDPQRPQSVYAGCDIGVWHSGDAGQTWTPFQSALPDAPIMDLKIHPTERLLHAATFGRGVYETRLGDGPQPDQDVFIRRTVVDRGTGDAPSGQDPFNPYAELRVNDSPDIVVSHLPNTNPVPDIVAFDRRRDDAATGELINSAATTPRVTIQAHNRGVMTTSEGSEAQIGWEELTTVPAVNFDDARRPIPNLGSGQTGVVYDEVLPRVAVNGLVAMNKWQAHALTLQAVILPADVPAIKSRHRVQFGGPDKPFPVVVPIRLRGLDRTVNSYDLRINRNYYSGEVALAVERVGRARLQAGIGLSVTGSEVVDDWLLARGAEAGGTSTVRHWTPRLQAAGENVFRLNDFEAIGHVHNVSLNKDADAYAFVVISPPTFQFDVVEIAVAQIDSQTGETVGDVVIEVENLNTFVPRRTILRRGDFGADVVQLQELLAAAGYPIGFPDGDFGPGTERCVRQFQADHGLVADGVVGPRTFQMLQPPSVPFAGQLLRYRAGDLMRGDAVRTMQHELVRAKCMQKSDVDGVFGRGTERSVKAFQKLIGVNQDGVIGRITWRILLNR